jgi:hypothetical protein
VREEPRKDSHTHRENQRNRKATERRAIGISVKKSEPPQDLGIRIFRFARLFPGKAMHLSSEVLINPRGLLPIATHGNFQEVLALGSAIPISTIRRFSTGSSSRRVATRTTAKTNTKGSGPCFRTWSMHELKACWPKNGPDPVLCSSPAAATSQRGVRDENAKLNERAGICQSNSVKARATLQLPAGIGHIVRD